MVGQGAHVSTATLQLCQRESCNSHKVAHVERQRPGKGWGIGNRDNDPGGGIFPYKKVWDAPPLA